MTNLVGAGGNTADSRVVLSAATIMVLACDSAHQFQTQRGPVAEHIQPAGEAVCSARSLGSTGPDHYLFPFRDKRSKLYDPTRPASASWLKYQWKRMVGKALEQGAIKFPIKPHNLRHQIITKLLEDGQPEEVVRAIAGHVSRKMMEHYSHARIQRKFEALDAINPDRKRMVKPASASVPAKNYA